MTYFKILTSGKAKNLVAKRQGEIKFGEEVLFGCADKSIEEQIKQTPAKFILFGIAEDIGVRANFGKPGAKNAWRTVLKTLLNIQSNQFNSARELLVLGHFDFDTIDQSKSKSNEIKSLRNAVKTIDSEVSNLVYLIKKNGKIPIAVGGGHNNAYGLIKGCSLALKSKINVINLDAHTDLRALEGRHSGNGFSYAIFEGFLDRYFIFGLHENYTSESILKSIYDSKQIEFISFESVCIKNKLSFKKALKMGGAFVGSSSFGIEIDCDAIAHCPSSAMTPTGFSSTQTRQFVINMSQNTKSEYLHICEAAPKNYQKKRDYNVGKLISALITDFMGANTSNN